MVQIGTGVTIGSTKLFNPFILVGGLLTTIACGLMMTLQPDSNSSIWIGYQALAGIGIGLCFNVYIIVIQNIVQSDDVATATAIILCEIPIFQINLRLIAHTHRLLTLMYFQSFNLWEAPSLSQLPKQFSRMNLSILLHSQIPISIPPLFLPLGHQRSRKRSPR